MNGTCCLYGAERNDLDAGNIHYKDHWKRGGAENETVLGPKMATSEASAICAQKSRVKILSQRIDEI